MVFSLKSLEDLEKDFENLKSKDLNLDLTRGKPSTEQLNLSEGLDTILSGKYSFQGVEIRNYGELLGLEECRKIGSEIFGCPTEMVIAGGNSSLTLISQYLSSLYFHGSGEGPWSMQDRNSFFCPVPGYDRHFKLCEEFAINMIPISLTGKGPNIEEIKLNCKNDSSIKGIWCVPKHSNPTGETYSEDCIKGLLEIAKSRKGFRILWDNAYAVHDFKDSEPLPNIFSLAEEQGVLDSVIAFTSTSKITYAGSGLGFMSLSKNNLKRFMKYYSSVTIGPDKVNQARHVSFFKDFEGLKMHMEKHARILRPKFEIVEKWLSEQNYGSWTKPSGGYFVSYNGVPETAKEIISLASKAGLRLTPAGSTFPYGIDPDDQNIRIAPTACSVAELELAMEVFVTCVSLVSKRRSI